ncbi:hypothetical protein J4466_01715 [Candidatus Pacearchaeota archaeon]|nr:hypothetical protein [Candidatus Pacearchaeota archaeon]
MNFRECYEFFKYLNDRLFGIIFIDRGFVDDLARQEIEGLKINLDILKRSYSFSALESGLFGIGVALFPDFERKILKQGNYAESFSYYTYASWELNKEFRRLHDQVSAYLD